jgi:hypothetical protein
MDDRESKNSVFSQATPQQVQGIPAMSLADRAKAEFSYSVPIEIVPLPSNGLVYPVGSPFYMKDSIEIKVMTAKEEDILTSTAFMKKGTTISELLKSCILDKTVNPADLLVGDRAALMVAIRVTGYGSDYEAEVECSKCEAKTKRLFDLKELEIKRLTINPLEEGKNLFEVTLPLTKKVVKFKFLTGRDEEEASQTKEKQKKLGLPSESHVTSMLHQNIIAIDSVTDKAAIGRFIQVMPARDSLSLRSYIRNNEPGIVMSQNSVCPSCEAEEEVSIPIGPSFLWPQSS